jgi:hypothetical protein
MSHAPTLSEWQTLYNAVMTETDQTKIPGKMYDAEAAIFNRLQMLGTVKNCDERTALDDAIRGLRDLKRELLNFPDWM